MLGSCAYMYSFLCVLPITDHFRGSSKALDRVRACVSICPDNNFRMKCLCQSSRLLVGKKSQEKLEASTRKSIKTYAGTFYDS